MLALLSRHLDSLYMLPKRLRLSREAFSSSHTGKKTSSAHFSITYIKSVATGGMAVVVSKKIAPHSVDRHLLKRRILSIMRPFHTLHTSLIVYAKAKSNTLPYSTLKSELGDLLKQVFAT